MRTCKATRSATHICGTRPPQAGTRSMIAGRLPEAYPRRRWPEVLLVSPISLLAVLACVLGPGRLPASEPPNPPLAGGNESTAGAGACDWPFLRGPNFDGHADAAPLLDSLPRGGPPVLWTRQLGDGYSGFTADSRRVYTQYQTFAGQYLACLDAATGDTVWQYRYEAPYELAGLYPGPRGTPSLGPLGVYFAAPSGLVGCVDRNSGRLVWSLNVFERFGVEPVEFGYSCSPTLAGGKVLLAVGRPGASLVALEPATGAVLWQAGNDPVSHVPPLPIRFLGRPLVVGYLRNALIACDLERGDVVWRKPLSQGYDEHAAWPIYSEPYLWISAPFQAGSQLLELTSDPPGCRTKWKSKRMSNDVCSSVLVDGCIYGFDIKDVQAKTHRPSRGQFRCIDLLTGQERWANGPTQPDRRTEGDPQNCAAHGEPGSGAKRPIGHASVLYADGKLILLNDRGEVLLARANPDRYEELGRVQTLGGEICWTQPALLDGRLYVRNHSRAAALDLRAADSAPAPAARRLTVADIPQTAYRDWAGMILAVEPEFAMDLPTRRQLWLWFEVCFAVYAVAALLAAILSVATYAWRRGPAQSAIETASGFDPDQMPDRAAREFVSFRGLHGGLAMVLAALGTTFISGLTGRFIFTWPLPLFVLFQMAVYETRPKEAPRPERRWAASLHLAVFLAGGLGYFLICRRLSLATEWVFLTGFLAAVPLLLAARRQSQRGTLATLGETVLLFAAFAAYYGGCVAVLAWRYAA
jgi:outer membrane protein assembly factor BamB